MKAKLTVSSSGKWSLSKVVFLPETILHVGSKIHLDLGPEGIVVYCVLVDEEDLKEGADIAGWEAIITFVIPGVRVVDGGRSYVDENELFAELQKHGWK